VSEVISWFASPADLLVVENAPLDDWQLFNLLDYICAADLGEGEDTQRLNAIVNARSPFARAGAAYYRRFFAAFASRTAAAAAARFADQAREAGPTDPAQHVRGYAAGILSLREGLRKRFAAELLAKEAQNRQLEAHIRTVESKLQQGPFDKDAHIAKLEAGVAAAEHQLQGVLASRSWRVTEPLRAAGNAIRQIVRAIRVSAAGWQNAWTIRERWRLRRTYRTIVASGLFDAAWYRARYPNVAAAGVDPLAHYLSSGAREGRDPHPDFDSAFYLRSNPDVVAANVNPLVHFVRFGRREGRFARRVARSYVPPRGLLPWFNPLNVAVSAALSNEPRLNVLVPAPGMRKLSGGPNTALVLAGRLAAAGVRVRLVSTDLPPDEDSAPFWQHDRNLLGGDLPPGLELVDAHGRSKAWVRRSLPRRSNT
jgi:hypothetical protein